MRPTCSKSYPDKDYTMEMIRRGLYHSTFAGGVANIWGHLPAEPPACACEERPLPRADWVKTWSRVFAERFLPDLAPCNERTGGGALCLGDPAAGLYLFYREGTTEIALDLSGVAGPVPVVAVDTTAPYAEIDLGTLGPGSHTFAAPGGRVSDWLVAAGDFAGSSGGSGSFAATPGPAPLTGLSPSGREVVAPDAEGLVRLRWDKVDGVRYRLRMLADGAVVVPWTDRNVANLEVPVELGKDYHWFVRAVDQATGGGAIPLTPGSWCGSPIPAPPTGRGSWRTSPPSGPS